MKNLKKFHSVIICIILFVSSAYSQNEENYETIMDCASSAFVKNVTYLGKGSFSFMLKDTKNENRLTDQNKFGERNQLVLRFNADILDGTQILVYPENEGVPREDVKLTGKGFLNLLISKMQTRTPINLTFSVKLKDDAVLETEREFEIVYFQVNGE